LADPLNALPKQVSGFGVLMTQAIGKYVAADVTRPLDRWGKPKSIRGYSTVILLRRLLVLLTSVLYHHPLSQTGSKVYEPAIPRTLYIKEPISDFAISGSSHTSSHYAIVPKLFCEVYQLCHRGDRWVLKTSHSSRL